jgi:hypothetical protein
VIQNATIPVPGTEQKPGTIDNVTIMMDIIHLLYVDDGPGLLEIGKYFL